MGHNAFVDGYKKPNFRLHLIIFLTIVGVSVFLSTQVEKSKEKTRIEALKVPVPIDSVFVDENAQNAKPRVETPKVASTSSVIKEPEVEYHFENGPNLAAIDSMLASTDEPVSDVNGVVAVSTDSTDDADKPVSEPLEKTTISSVSDKPETERANRQAQGEEDVAIMVTDDVIPENAETEKVSETTADNKSAGSNNDVASSTDEPEKSRTNTVAKMDAVYELQQDRFLETLAKTANQKAEETIEVKRIKQAIRSDKALKLKSTVKKAQAAQNDDKIVKVAATNTSGVLNERASKDSKDNQKNIVVAKESRNLKPVVKTPATDPVNQITLTRSELNNVLNQFARSYNKGDIKRLMALFDENAVTNDQNNKPGIKAEYDELFKTTSNRHIKIRNIQWNLSSDKAKGDARFTVTVQPLGSAEPAQIEGKIEILAVKEDRGVFIKRLLHRVITQ